MMKRLVQDLPIELVSLNDVNISLNDVQETGNTPLENAKEKTLAYYQDYQAPMFACDSGLYIEHLSEDLQPGVHVRRVFGKTLNDKEMIAYYSGLAQHYQELEAYYQNGIYLILDDAHHYACMDTSLQSARFILTSVPHPHVEKGFPLDSISKDLKTGRYFHDMHEDERRSLGYVAGFTHFFQKALAAYAQEPLHLVRPKLEDLTFRQTLLADTRTMAFNVKWGGTVAFPKEKWESWYQKWLGSQDNHYFYRYLYSPQDDAFVGEVAYHRHEEKYILSVIIKADYRNRGFGKIGLQLLCQAAKNHGLDVVYDNIAKDNPSLRLFLNEGFTKTGLETNEYIEVCKYL